MISDRWESRVLLRGRGSRDLSRRRFFQCEKLVPTRRDGTSLPSDLSPASAVREEESRFSSCPLSASFHTFREYKRLLSLDSRTRVHFFVLTCAKKYSGYGSETRIPQLFSIFHQLKEAILFYIIFFDYIE